ncbi:MAG: Gfo/Idh/MocA family protein, partial [Planctomycetota bacterium]
ITSSALGGPGREPASERVAMGFIGLGGHGIGRNLRMFLPQRDCQVVALCDVDARHLQRAQGMVRKRGDDPEGVLVTRDWREVIAHDDVDGVQISTPDHWHCLMSVWAIEAGKDVICEKPTYNIHEGRVLADTVRRYGAVFQTSTEDRSVAIYHRMAELVRNRRIGDLRRIHVRLPSGPGSPGDPTPRPVPDHLDWDMWLGPAPWAPYCPGRVHHQFRYVRDTGAGILADWGCHQLDTAQWAHDTERTGPVHVEGTGKRHQTGLYDTFYQFDLHYRYADGVELHVQSGGTSLRFEGTEGWVGNSGWRRPLEASSQAILDSVIGPDETHLFTCPAGEHRNFLDCVKSRRDPYFPAEVGHRCASVAHIGTIALELRRPLRWDPEGERFPDEPEANRLLTRPMRAPWRI